MAPEPLDVAVRDVIAALNDAGIRSVSDMRDLNPPGVYVGAPTVTFDRLCGEVYAADFPVYLVAPNVGRLTAIAHLSTLMMAVAGVYAVAVAEPLDLTDPSGGDPLPAYKLTISATVKAG